MRCSAKVLVTEYHFAAEGWHCWKHIFVLQKVLKETQSYWDNNNESILNF